MENLRTARKSLSKVSFSSLLFDASDASDASAARDTSDAPRRGEPPPISIPSVKRLFRSLAAQDWLITAYFLVALCAVIAGSGPGRASSALRIGVDIAILWTGLIVVRGEMLRPKSFASALIYRASVFGTVVLSYFQLREILPAVSSRALDAEILRIDMRLFGFEPALAWDRFVTPATTEWFAFFYFSYFILMVIHSAAFLLAVKDRDLVARFSLGIFTVFCVAHLVYMAVPGYGPYKAFPEAFQNKLAGGLFWGLTWDTVQAGGAMKDIFPSLHTAAPTYFTIFAFLHRDRIVFRYTWPALALFTSQIIIATMFLRWHYLIDIFAGLTLASSAAVIAVKVGAWEKGRRERMGAPPVFSPLELPLPGRVDAMGAMGAMGAMDAKRAKEDRADPMVDQAA